MLNKSHVQGMMTGEIRRRLANYPFYKDAKTRLDNCISEKSEYFMFQYTPPLSYMARKKIVKWKEYGDAYLYWCWRNATINFCHSILIKGEKIATDTSTYFDDNGDRAFNKNLEIKRNYLESFIDSNVHSEEKIRCYLDRLDGMSFPQMMKENEPINWAKDKKGQKYYRRFTRFVSQELGLKKEVGEYLQLRDEERNNKKLKPDLFVRFKSQVYSARAKITMEGVLVLAGAEACKMPTDSLPLRYKKVRSDLIEKGVFVLSGSKLKLTEDILFSSPTQASSILLGCPCNGQDYWLKDN